MFDNKTRKEERLKNRIPDTVSQSTYNLIIGALIIYGLLMNGLLAYVSTEFMLQVNPIIFIIAYFISCMIGTVITHRSSNPIISFVGYNLIAVPIGLLLSLVVPFYSIDLVLSAILITAAITGIMMALSVVFPNIFEKMGIALFVSLLIAIIAETIAMLCGYGGDAFNWIFVILFSLYIGYDWHKAQQYSKTVDNAVDCSVDLYLDIINIFLRILRLLGRSSKK